MYVRLHVCMDLKYAQIRSQLLRIAHYNLVCSALYSKIRRSACVFMRILEPCMCVCVSMYVCVCVYACVCV